MMKKLSMKKKLAVVLTSLALLAGPLAATAGASSDVSARISPDTTIIVDGVERTFYNVSGQEVQPIMYNGTTYLPVRAIGELMDKNVDWNQSTLTITLSSPRQTPAVTGTPTLNAQVTTVTASLRDDFTIVVDGVERNFYDANQAPVYPLLHNGTTYLPVRAIGELMGKQVGWNQTTRTVTLSSDSLVTDADSFGDVIPDTTQGATTPGTASGAYIGEARAQQIALNHAGLTASQVKFARTHLDWEYGRMVYEVEFYSSTYQEYDYEIDATTGTILSFDYDAEYYNPPASSNYIGEARAQQIALNHAGLTSSQVSYLRCHLDWDDGRAEYQVEFISGLLEYDVEINATTGAIIGYDVDSIYD